MPDIPLKDKTGKLNLAIYKDNIRRKSKTKLS